MKHKDFDADHHLYFNKKIIQATKIIINKM